MIPEFLKNLLNWINLDLLVLLIFLVCSILIILQMFAITKLNSCIKAQRQQLPYLADINNSLASLPTSDEYTSQVVEKMAVELKSTLRVSAGQREIVLQNLNEIQAMIEDVKQEVVTKEISRHRLNALISTSLKKSK